MPQKINDSTKSKFNVPNSASILLIGFTPFLQYPSGVRKNRNFPDPFSPEIIRLF